MDVSLCLQCVGSAMLEQEYSFSGQKGSFQFLILTMEERSRLTLLILTSVILVGSAVL